MSKNYNFCNNCGKTGHAFHHCKHPITSIGIIAYRSIEDEYQFLMIRRKDTLGYVDFMRGKYPIYNKLYLQNIIDGDVGEVIEALRTYENAEKLKEGEMV